MSDAEDKRSSADESDSDSGVAGAGKESSSRKRDDDPRVVIINSNEEVAAMEKAADEVADTERPDRAAATLIGMSDRLSELKDALKRIEKKGEAEDLVTMAKKVLRRVKKLKEKVASLASSEEIAGGKASRAIAKNADKKRAKDRDSKRRTFGYDE